MTEELGLVCHAPLSVSARQQNADEVSALSIASIPLRHDRHLVDGTPCLREPRHDRPGPLGAGRPTFVGRGGGGRVDLNVLRLMSQSLKKHLLQLSYCREKK